MVYAGVAGVDLVGLIRPAIGAWSDGYARRRHKPLSPGETASVLLFPIGNSATVFEMLQCGTVLMLLRSIQISFVLDVPWLALAVMSHHGDNLLHSIALSEAAHRWHSEQSRDVNRVIWSCQRHPVSASPTALAESALMLP
jgi:hypothetical protein